MTPDSAQRGSAETRLEQRRDTLGAAQPPQLGAHPRGGLPYPRFREHLVDAGGDPARGGRAGPQVHPGARPRHPRRELGLVEVSAGNDERDASAERRERPAPAEPSEEIKDALADLAVCEDEDSISHWWDKWLGCLRGFAPQEKKQVWAAMSERGRVLRIDTDTLNRLREDAAKRRAQAA